MTYLCLFFAGAFLLNAVPHLVAGVSGRPFPSPFAKPPGIGDSSPVVNVLWGFFNALVGWSLLAWHPVAFGFDPAFGCFVAGALSISVFAARHFGQHRAATASHPTPSDRASR